MLLYLVIGMGGFIGAVLRYSLSEFIQSKLTQSFPFGTFLVNILGCFLLGFLSSVLLDKDILYRMWINVGILGSFTTFSTFSIESFNLFSEERYALFFINIVSSFVLGIVALWVGKGTYDVLFK